ncbi:MAG: O-antigen ligase family protein [bacterium]|nr:O-antigen ligase family protein [bacterium]
MLSTTVFLWILVSFFNIKISHLRAGLKNKTLWLCYSFFAFTVFSALLSQNKTEAAFSLEVKLSFLLFPYLFFCFEWPPAILKRCVISFVSGCFFACLYLIARALVYVANGQPEYLFYTLFSDLIHASYFSMYLILAIIFVLLLYRNWFHTQKSVIYSSYFFVSIFIATIFLCSSKLGMISFFTCLPLALLYKWREHLNFKVITVFTVGLLVILILMIKVFPESFSRLNSLKILSSQNIDKTSGESTTVRILIWEQSMELIKHNWLMGTGVGDANDELYKRYERNGLLGASKHHLNAHNQFFQTFIGAGIVGFLILLTFTVGKLVYAIRRRKIILFLFTLLIIMNFMVESMLQTSAGVFFFVFFLCFFRLADESELADGAAMNPY